MFWKFLNNIESYICRLLLSGFVILLFVQIVSREVFGHSFSWIEELSVYMFVWFVYFGASYAALKGAHNRVTFQFKFLLKRAGSNTLKLSPTCSGCSSTAISCGWRPISSSTR